MSKPSTENTVRALDSAHWDEKRLGMTYEEFRKGMDDYANDRLWFYENLDELRKKHVNSWVAIINKRVIDSDANHDALTARIKASENGLAGVHILYVRPKDMLVIY